MTRRKAPLGFNAGVLKPGLAWLKTNKIPLSKKLAAGTKLKPIWRDCLDDLHERYDGVCAYLCVWIEPSTGGASVDHFVAKSTRAGDAYLLLPHNFHRFEDLKLRTSEASSNRWRRRWTRSEMSNGCHAV